MKAAILDLRKKSKEIVEAWSGASGSSFITVAGKRE